MRWQKENPELENKRHRIWRLKNPSKYVEQETNWRKAHIDLLNKYTKDWEERHPVLRLEVSRRSYKKHREQRIKKSQAYQKNHPNETKQIRKRHLYKRQKELGYITLNSYFKNSNGHHIDKEHVIYIPEIKHKQYPHNHNKPETMNQINKIAFNFLFGRLH